MNILITGANRGLGLGLATIYAQRGDHVFACARSLNTATELAALRESHSERLRCFALDVASDASCVALSQALGDARIDVLINNAGAYGSNDTLEKVDWEEASAVMNVNAFGPLRVAQSLVKNLVKPGAKVINITSKMGSIGDNAQGGAYAYRMSKAALNMGAKNLSLQWRTTGVVVVALHPGWVKTRMGGNSAPLSVVDSTQNIVDLVDRLTLADTGKFFNYDGVALPW